MLKTKAFSLENLHLSKDKMKKSSETTQTNKPKPHIVCVTFPAQGHVIPMMQLAKLLHSNGLYITFINTEFNHNRLIRAKGGSSDWVDGFSDFKFESMRDGLPPSDRDATQLVDISSGACHKELTKPCPWPIHIQDPPALCYAMRDNCLAAALEVLERVRSKEGVPPISCVVSDGLMTGAMKAAHEIGVPGVQLWTASACGFWGYLQSPQLLRSGIIPFKDENYKHDGTLNQLVEWIPGMKDIRLRDLPALVRITNKDDILFTFQNDETQNCLKASAILFNTFDSFEQEILNAIKPISPPIYAIGPLPLMEQKHVPESPLKSFWPSLWRDEAHCLNWLAQQRPKSVVYVNYGSVTVMSHATLIEFAWGLANSRQHFLWVLRPDVVMGESESVMLPHEFTEETRDRGLVVEWTPQEQVLAHPAVGVFLTHCGWNSLLESVCHGGLSVICWPFFFEQQTNCRYACQDDEWGFGIQINEEVKRRDVEDMIRKVMEGNVGEKLRKSALGWQVEAHVATSVGGSCFDNLKRFLKEILHFDNTSDQF